MLAIKIYINEEEFLLIKEINYIGDKEKTTNVVIYVDGEDIIREFEGWLSLESIVEQITNIEVVVNE